MHRPTAKPILLILLLTWVGATILLRAQTQDEDQQKKELFLQTQTSSHTGEGTVTHHKSKPKSTPQKHPSTKSKSKHSTAPKKHHAVQSASPDEATNEAKHSSASHHKTPQTPVASSSQKAEEVEKKPAVPVANPTGEPAVSPPSANGLSLPHGANPSAPITIEKSGAGTEEGFEPAPVSSPTVSHGWDWLFGSHRTYHYLSASTRSAIDKAPVRRGRWKYIVVHNSGTREGNARIFDIYHRRVRHMVNGLAYHFVIGDGHGSGDGEIEIGHRWTAQLNGGHVASDYLNDIALGICLVGDFNRDLPTKAQIGALEELIDYLRIRVGKTQGRQAIVHAHKEINPKPTDCPGSRFPYKWLHATFGNVN